MTNFRKVCVFNQSFGLPHTDTLEPDVLKENKNVSKLRVDLCVEEAEELTEAITTRDFTEVIDRTKECMGQLNLNNIWNKEFCQRIYTICKCLHRVERSNNDVGDIPHEICLNILDYVVDDILSFTIWKGLKFITDESVQSKLMQKGVYYHK